MLNIVLYDLDFNKKAHWLSPIYGIARLGVHSYFLASHLIKISLLALEKLKEGHFSESQFRVLLAKASIDLRGIIRGIIELPPFLGGLGSLLWDRNLITPAQRLAFRIQEIYQTRLNQDESYLNDPDLVDVNPSLYHPEFCDFINGQKVKMSNDQEKIDQFIKSFLDVDVDNSIFNDKKLPFYALAAFAQNKIDRQDMATLMEFYMAKQCFEDCKLCNTFDREGNLTKDAIDLHEYLLCGTKLAAPAPSDHIVETFKNGLRTLPRQKQIFWHYEALFSQEEFKKLEKDSPSLALELFYSPVGSLYASLANIGGLKVSHGREISLSFDSERLLLNLKYDKTKDPFLPKLGMFSAREVKQNVMDHSRRLCATFFPGASKLTSVHNSLELPTSIVSHDKSHGHILQFTQKEAVADIKRIVRRFEEVICEDIKGYDLTKETWQLIEMVAPALFSSYNQINYLNSLVYDSSNKVDETQISDLFFNNEEPTPLFWVMYLDMLNNENIYASKNSVKSILSKFEGIVFKHITCVDTIKQKIWKLQHVFKGLPSDKAPADSELEFSRVSEGFRKNTIILRERAVKS